MSKMNPTLAEFGKCVVALTELLHNDGSLDMKEQMFIENHIEILRVIFKTWKRRKTS
jgi:hypothetical protein